MLVHKGTQELITKRLKLRKYTLSDGRGMYKNYAADERVTKYLFWRPYKNIEDIETFLSSEIAKYECENFYHWAIEIDNEIIGGISAYSIDENYCNCEVGYCLGYDYWNKGITSEALSAIINFLFNDVGMHRIASRHDVENPASGKVMQKCGMTCEGRLREHYLRHDGTRSDSLIYGILKNEFTQQV